MKNRLTFLIFSLLVLSTNAKAEQLCGKAQQGEILRGQTMPNTKIVYNGTELMSGADGSFLLAFGRDEISNPSITFINGDNNAFTRKLDVGKTKWDVQNLKGVPPRKVTPSDSDLRDIEIEQKLLKAALATKETQAFWQKGFIRPVEGRISGEFGGQRIMNGEKKNPHAGMDIAAKEGTPIKASSDGVVVLVAPEMFYSGNVIVLDHGFGLHTIYAHLQEIHVKRGDKVSKGDIIGLVGKTGRSTGAHLHWGASLNGVKFRPESLLNINNTDGICFTL